MGLFTGASLFNFEHIQPANLVLSWLTLNKYSLVRIFDFQKKQHSYYHYSAEVEASGKTQLK